MKFIDALIFIHIMFKPCISNRVYPLFPTPRHLSKQKRKVILCYGNCSPEFRYYEFTCQCDVHSQPRLLRLLAVEYHLEGATQSFERYRDRDHVLGNLFAQQPSDGTTEVGLTFVKAELPTHYLTVHATKSDFQGTGFHIW